MSVIDGFDLNNFNFMEWDYLAIYEVKVNTYRVFLLKKLSSESCCELVFGLLRSPKASM